MFKSLYIRTIFSLSLLIALTKTAENPQTDQFNNETTKIIEKVEIYLKEKNPDLKKLKKILLSGKVNGLLSTQEILDIFVHLSEKYPNLVKKEKIGNTFKKEDLFYYHLSNDF